MVGFNRLYLLLCNLYYDHEIFCILSAHTHCEEYSTNNSIDKNSTLLFSENAKTQTFNNILIYLINLL